MKSKLNNIFIAVAIGGAVAIGLYQTGKEGWKLYQNYIEQKTKNEDAAATLRHLMQRQNKHTERSACSEVIALGSGIIGKQILAVNCPKPN